jgi:small GTP-binding protein
MKVVIVGDTRVGKTSLLSRLVTGKFQMEVAPTIGAAIQSQTIATTKGIATLQIWDTAGQEKYRALAPMYYRNAQAVILVFDVTNANSFRRLSEWIAELEAKPGPVRLFLVGNKCDLSEYRAVDDRTARAWADEHGAAAYTETSALSGNGVTELFQKVADALSQETGAETLTDWPQPPEKKTCTC